MLKGFVFLLLDFASIYTKSMLNASIFLLQNASIFTISTQYASILFLIDNASTLLTYYVTKKIKCTNCYIGAKCVVSLRFCCRICTSPIFLVTGVSYILDD